MTVPASTGITYENIFSQSHALIFNILNDRGNIPDPNDSTGNRKFVYEREPRELGFSFQGYPVVIVNLFDVADNPDIRVLDESKKMLLYTVEVSVWTRDKKSDSLGDPSGAQTLNEISDNIIKTLNTATNNRTLHNCGLKGMNQASSPSSWVDQNNKMIFMRTFELNFSNFMSMRT